MKKPIVSLLISGALAVSACGVTDPAPDTGDVQHSTDPAEQSQDGEAPEAPNNRTESGQMIGPMGEELTNGGVALTVNNVSSQASVMLEPRNRKKGSTPPEEVFPENQGAKFIKVETTVRNEGMAPWDLTCGYAVGTALYDVEGRHYEPIKQLYRVPENPACNASLGPGFESPMTWIYEVPESFEELGFGFFDPKENFNDPALVRIEATPQ